MLLPMPFRLLSILFRKNGSGNYKVSHLPTYTRAQLALHNGQDKPEIWVAYKGVIYDVTKSRLWREGKHYEHWAGQDLTDELPDAPHSERVFDKFNAVGRLGDGQ